jgi:hypothetical protein
MLRSSAHVLRRLSSLNGRRASLFLLVLLVGNGVLGADLPLRWRWSNPKPHGGNIFDMASKLGLVVEVAERGQIYTSEDLLLWEPRESRTRRSLRAVTFFGNRIVITGENGIVVYADSLLDFQPVDLGTTDWLEGVATSSNLVVAVGDNGAIYTSPNGADWHRQSTSIKTWLRGVAFASGTFVAVGESGFIATSPDGTNWTKRTSPTSLNLNRVAWIHDRFWAVGDNGTVLSSPGGGANWTPVLVGPQARLFSAAGNQTDRLVVGDQVVQLQSGNVGWTDQTAIAGAYPAPLWTYYNSLWQDGSFFVSGRSGMMLEGFQTNSASAFVWINRVRSVRNWLFEVQRAPDFYVTVGFNGTIMTSENGREWHLELVPDSATNSVFLGVGGTTNLLLAVGDQGSLLISPQVFTNVVLTNATGTVSTNLAGTLGVLWHAVEPRPTTNDLQGVTVWKDQFVLCGSSGTVLLSPDGTNWSEQATPTGNFLSGLAAFDGGLVAVGQNGTILTSPDGQSWTNLPPPSTNWIYRVRNAGGQLIAVGQNGTILTSPDGVAWTAQKSGTDRWLNDVTYLDGTWFIAGNQGTVLASTNLLDWNDAGVITEKSLFGLAHHDGQLITVGVEGAILRSLLEPSPEPVRFLDFSRDSDRNLFLISGQPDQRFTLDKASRFNEWITGPVFEFLDDSGTLLILDSPDTNAPPNQFFRGTLVP